MHIRILEQFLASLRAPLQALGAAGGVDELQAALTPYADWPVADFTAFLRAAEGYRRSGQVDIPKPEDAGLKRAIESFAAVRTAVKESNAAAATEAQQAAAAALAEAAAPLGLAIKTTINKKWLAGQLAEARTNELTRQLRAVAARIAGPDSYAGLQADIAALDALPAADWKLLAQALGHKLPSKNKAVAALTHLAGYAPPAARKPGQLSADELLPFVNRLRDRIERSNDRDAFPRSEVETQIGELDGLDAGSIKAILKEANFTFSGKPTKPNMLNKLREFLDAGHRAFERVQA